MGYLISIIYGFIFVAIAGWVTHIYWSITTLLGSDPMTVNEGAIAIIGAFLAPIGALHGIYLWF